MQVRFENIDIPLYDGRTLLKLDNVQLNHVNVRIDAETECITLSQENIEQSPVNAEKPLAEYSPGDVVSIAGYDFIVLEHEGQTIHNEETTKVILRNSLGFRCFSDNDNNWSNSDLREWLHKSDLNIVLADAIGGHNLCTMHRDLVALDGTSDYGESADFVSLLTFDEYRKYHKSFGLQPCGTRDWWLLTPFSTCSHNTANVVCIANRSGYVYWETTVAPCEIHPIYRIKSTVCATSCVKTNQEE